MDTENISKINQLIASTPRGIVLTSSWLVNRGYSLDLQKRYRSSNWLKSIGTGAMIMNGDTVKYTGAIYALQRQLGLSTHIGGKSALALQGKAHYLELQAGRVILFGQQNEQLPTWFKLYDWDAKIEYYQSAFLPPEMGMTEVDFPQFTLKVSSPARAMLECLYMVPNKQELLECYEIMEGLNNLRPNQVQELLESCKSVKVKRLFLYLAEKAGHSWFDYLDLDKLDLGSGKRSIVENGVLIKKYGITVAKELEKNGQSEL